MDRNYKNTSFFEKKSNFWLYPPPPKISWCEEILSSIVARIVVACAPAQRNMVAKYFLISSESIQFSYERLCTHLNRARTGNGLDQNHFSFSRVNRVKGKSKKKLTAIKFCQRNKRVLFLTFCCCVFYIFTCWINLIFMTYSIKVNLRRKSRFHQINQSIHWSVKQTIIKSNQSRHWSTKLSSNQVINYEPWSINQSIMNQSINQSTNQLINQSVRSLINHFIIKSRNQSRKYAISQFIDQSINLSIHQSINLSLHQSIYPSINLSINQSINQTTWINSSSPILCPLFLRLLRTIFLILS